MCQYSSDDGSPSAWHYKHLGALVCSGASMLVIESTAVSSEGRISKKIFVYIIKNILKI